MKADPKHGRHFPDTLCIEVDGVCVQVQEKVDMDHGKKGRGGWRIEDAVDNLATRLGIKDCHLGNYGWKGEAGKEYPVFIDVDFRFSETSTKPALRSWMV